MTAVVLIVNPVAGGGRAAHGAHAMLASLLDTGLDTRVVVPGDREGTQRAAHEAAASGAAAVIACGGDGTVHDVLQELAGTSTALGVVPAGSGDDAAAGLACGVGPQDAPEIRRQLHEGDQRRVDLGRVVDASGRHAVFATVLCTGFDARVNARANTYPRLGGQRYTAAMLRELAVFRPIAYRVGSDSGMREREAMIVTIGNADRYGGGMRICPQADVEDGLLDVTMIDRISRPRLLSSFRLVYEGRHVALPFVHTERTAVVRIEAEGQVGYADGERIGPLPLKVDCWPGALLVLRGRSSR